MNGKGIGKYGNIIRNRKEKPESAIKNGNGKRGNTGKKLNEKLKNTSKSRREKPESTMRNRNAKLTSIVKSSKEKRGNDTKNGNGKRENTSRKLSVRNESIMKIKSEIKVIYKKKSTQSVLSHYSVCSRSVRLP
jgi:hypothetical protein